MTTAMAAGIANNNDECKQDIAAMNRIISLLSTMNNEQELDIRMRLHADTKETHDALCNAYEQKQKRTK